MSLATKIAYGPVVDVRAVHSREVTVIKVEIPEEHHVAATVLLYGQDVVVTLLALPVQIIYGVHQVDKLELPEESRAEEEAPAQEAGPTGAAGGTKAEEPFRAVTGHASVRPMPAQGISVITIEIPEKFHVSATQLMYGRTVMITPTRLGKQAYGVMGDAPPEQNQAPRRAGGLGQERELNVVSWLGARCAESQFQDFMQVRNQADAIERVRQTCGVSTRKDIPGNPQAMRAFRELILEPYQRHLQGASRPRFAGNPFLNTARRASNGQSSEASA